MHFLQRFAPAFFIGLCIVSGSFAVFPTAARAQLPVTDIAHITVSSGNALQNTITAFTAGKQVLNPIFWRLAQTAIQSTVNSTVKWINSGFNGSPAYASDLSNSLLRAGDTEANRFIADFQKNASINSPFRDAVAQNVLRAYYLSTSKDGFYLQNPYTLNKVSPDDAAFIAGEFTKGGLSAWLSLSGNCSNNPICAHDQAQRALNAQVISVQGKLAQEVANGNGFFSFHGKCKSSAPAAAGAGKVGVALSNSDDCLNQPIQTPGTVIANQLNKALGLGSDSLIQAHSFDEIVNALLGQLMKNVLGDSGLGGLSKGSASTGGRPYFDQSVSSTDSTTASASSIFINTLNNQGSQSQVYLDNWNSINMAALDARDAVLASSCISDPQSVINTQVTPVISMSAGAIGKGKAALATIDALRQKSYDAITLPSSQQSATNKELSDSFAASLNNGEFPSPTDVMYSSRQVVLADSASLLSQMTALTAQAKCGG